MSGSNCFDLRRPAFAPPGHAALVEPLPLAEPAFTDVGGQPAARNAPVPELDALGRGRAPDPGPEAARHRVAHEHDARTVLRAPAAAARWSRGRGRELSGRGRRCEVGRGHLLERTRRRARGRDHERDREGRGAGRYEYPDRPTAAARRGGWVARRCKYDADRDPERHREAQREQRCTIELRASLVEVHVDRPVPEVEAVRDRADRTQRADRQQRAERSGPVRLRDARDHERDEHGGEREAAAVLPRRAARRSSSR